jgi:hypothetical protein
MSQTQRISSMKLTLVLIVVLGSLSVATRAEASDLTGRVTSVTAESMPGQVIFTLNTSAPECAAGNQIVFNASSADQAKAVMSIVVAMQLSGAQLWARFTGPCVVSMVHSYTP